MVQLNKHPLSLIPRQVVAAAPAVAQVEAGLIAPVAQEVAVITGAVAPGGVVAPDLLKTKNSTAKIRIWLKKLSSLIVPQRL
jgi:hypothetical protein